VGKVTGDKTKEVEGKIQKGVGDEAHQALTGEKTGLGYQLGDTVQVRLAEAVPLAGALRFEMLSPGRKMPVGSRSFHKAGRRTSRPSAKPGTRPPRGRR